MFIPQNISTFRRKLYYHTKLNRLRYILRHAYSCIIITVPSISSLKAQSITSDSITLSWTIPEGVTIDNYTLTVTRLCDNVVFPPTTGINGSFTTIPISGLSSGLQYTVGIIPFNILGTGMESSVNATVMEGTGEILV